MPYPDDHEAQPTLVNATSDLDAEQFNDHSRLLEAVQRQQLTSHEGRRNKQSNKGDRDW